MSNVDKTSHYVAVVLDDLKRLGVRCQCTVIEKAVRDTACGNVSDSRYFLKKGVNATAIKGQPKQNLRKVRCCTFSKEILKQDTLRRLYQGNPTYNISYQQGYSCMKVGSS